MAVDCQDVTSNIVAGLRGAQEPAARHVRRPHEHVQWQRRVRREWYTIAWPEHERDAPMLTDLFDGLAYSPVPSPSHSTLPVSEHC